VDHTALTDEKLFELWLTQRDCVAFAELDARYRDALLGFAERRLQRFHVPAAADCAQDCVQETFLRLSLRMQPLPSVRNWLYCVLRNLLNDEGRRHGRQPAMVSIHPGPEEDASGIDPVDDDLGPLAELLNTETPPPDLMASFLECLEELAEHLRQLIEMHYLEGHSYVVIAERTGLSKETITGRLFKARKQLRECFRRRLSEPE
jgi:RNA polymerase sigma factor (sigma-70 family)